MPSSRLRLAQLQPASRRDASGMPWTLGVALPIPEPGRPQPGKAGRTCPADLADGRSPGQVLRAACGDPLLPAAAGLQALLAGGPSLRARRSGHAGEVALRLATNSPELAVDRARTASCRRAAGRLAGRLPRPSSG